jgi:LacI family transcriptional regulator
MLRVAYCGTTRNGYFADVFRGFKSWVASDPEVMQVSWLGSEEIGPRSLEYLELDGFIMGPVEDREITESAMRLPQVCFSNFREEKRAPHVINDDPAVGRLAAESLLKAGYERLAVVHGPNFPALERMRGFCECAAERHIPCTVLPVEIRRLKEKETFHDVFWEHRSEIREFVKQLSPNTGIFCPFYYDAVEVREMISTDTNLTIPENIGLIAGEQPGEPFRKQELAHVMLDGQRIGARAGEVLKEIITGRRSREAQIIQIAPTEIHRGKTLRQSSSEILVEKVRQFYETRLDHAVTVDQVAAAVGLSRRVLELRFKEMGLPSPYEYLTRMRLRRAEDLLITTNLSIDQIAEACGYGEARILTKRFRAFKGMPPSRFRKQHLL